MGRKNIVAEDTDWKNEEPQLGEATWWRKYDGSWDLEQPIEVYEDDEKELRVVPVAIVNKIGEAWQVAYAPYEGFASFYPTFEQAAEAAERATTEGQVQLIGPRPVIDKDKSAAPIAGWSLSPEGDDWMLLAARNPDGTPLRRLGRGRQAR